MGAVGEPHLHAHFHDLEQQRETATLGMWVFLATEVMFFGAMFTSYSVYRYLHPLAWKIGGEHMDKPIGTINTAVLLTSSLFAALAVRAAKRRSRGGIILWAVCVAVLGALFDALKLYEYYKHIRDGLLPGAHFTLGGVQGPEAELFFVHYFIMTGIHAIHVLIGIGVFATLAVLAALGRFSRGHHDPVEVSALYWHFVDIVWIFLYPLFYLIE